MKSLFFLLCRWTVITLAIFPLSQFLLAQQSSRTTEGLGEYLDNSGRLNLPPSFAGSLNPAGYRLLVDEDGSPRFVSSTAAVAGDEKWDDRFGYQGISVGSEVGAMAVAASGEVYFAGDLSIIGGADSTGNILSYNPATRHWSRLGKGLDDLVWALAIKGDDLYAGGVFLHADGALVSGIARWNITSSTWSKLGSGIDGPSPGVFALAVSNGYLYTGGTFTMAGGISVNNIARWSLADTSWSQVGNGITGPQAAVRALLPSDSGVITGGHFNAAGGAPASNIASWNGSTWSPVGRGVNNDVFAMAPGPGGTIYVGGWFTAATNGDGSIDTVSAIASFNGIWSSIGGGVTGVGLPEVDALAYVNGVLYVGGIFDYAGGVTVPAKNVAFYTGAWHALGSGTAPAGFNRVRSLSHSGGLLFAGGDFYTAGQNASRGVCAWNDTAAAWEALGWGVQSGTVNAILVVYPDIYVGGVFQHAGGVIGADNIARFHPERKKWISMQNGVRGSFAAVYTLAYFQGDVYVGGRFDSAGTIAVHSLARWNPILTAWEDPGASLSSGDEVHALSVFSFQLYAGGNFTTIAGLPSPGIGRWDGSTWSAVGQGLISFTQVPTALAIAGTQSILYVGGIFNRVVQTNGDFVDVGNIARWDGSAWSELTGGSDTASVDGTVNALMPNGNSVYVGGAFTTVETSSPHQFITARRIALWTGHSWYEVAGGIVSGSTVNSLSMMGGNLFAGGSFTNAGGTSVNNIAYTDGVTWYALGTGAQAKYLIAAPAVNALAPSRSDSALYVGGTFDRAGAKASLSFARWRSSPPSSLWTPVPIDSTKTLSCLDFSQYPLGFVAGSGGYMAKTTNGGSNWTPLSPATTSDLTDIVAFSANDILTIDNKGFLCRTTDGGGTWNLRSISSPNGLRRFRWTDNMHGTVVGDSSHLSATTDGGLSWTSQVLAAIVVATLTDVYYFNPDTALIVGFGGVVLRTTNAGVSWSRIGSGTTNNFKLVFGVEIPHGLTPLSGRNTSGVSETIGFIGGDNGTILRSTDAGATFTVIPSGTVANLNGGGFVDNGNIYFCGDDGIILQSSDGGQSFTLDANAGPAALERMSFSNLLPQTAGGKSVASPTTAFAVRENGAVLTKQLVVTGVSGSSPSLPAAFSLSQNYPNPFNPSTTIRYELPKESQVTLNVYNLLGQRVAVLVDEKKAAGRYQVQFSAGRSSGEGDRANSLSSGVYFVRLQAGTFINVKKMLLMR